MNVEDVLCRLQSTRQSGGSWVARCPAHDDRNPSLSVPRADGGRVLLKCFAGCSYKAILAALKGSPIQNASGSWSDDQTKRGQPLDDRGRIQRATSIWEASKRAAETLVETYLRSRGINIAPPPSLRFHPSLKHPTGIYLPAMVAAVQNVDGQITAIHRTWLRADGSGKATVKPDKAMLGPTSGGAVRFAKPTERIAVAEGIETALSIAQKCPERAVWAALSTSGLMTLEIPQIVREVIVCADNDPSGAGDKAARAAAARITEQDRTRVVKIARPPRVGTDFNDLVRG